MSILDDIENIPDFYDTIRDGNDYEVIPVDIPQEHYDLLVELAGSDDEVEISNLVNKILTVKLNQLEQNDEDDV